MPTLEDRVDALEQLLASLPLGSDTLEPNYLTVNPDGTIGADFSGVISAQGVTLPSATAGAFPPPGPNRVRWTNVNGAAVADVWAASESGTELVRVDGIATGTDVSFATLAAMDGNGTQQAALECFQTSNGSAAMVEAIAGGKTRIVVNQAGYSDFLQGLGWALSWGTVETGSGTVIDPGSGDWTIGGTATGAVQLIGVGVGPSDCITLCTVAGGRSIINATYTCQASDGVNPVLSSWVNGVLTGGLSLAFVTLHQ